MTPGPTNSISSSRARLLPLYAAGFVAAFGSFGTAASLAGYLQFQHANLLTLGVLLATYSVAEILFKPVFGALADRIGARPVVIGGLVLFAVASAAFVVAHNLELVGLARFGQGIAAAAVSPTAGAVIARLT
uniref:MFS transporter n=1 Tax=Mycolicibacterium llatzerense TaxID=280871 RepID=UPI000ADD35C6